MLVNFMMLPPGPVRLRVPAQRHRQPMSAPLEGWRHVKVTDRHTAVDYAHVLKDLADTHFATAKVIVLVQDNLNIHSKASLYEAFPAAQARRLVERFEWHYTPKHGSWLDLAESELGVLSSQCLGRRIPDKQILVDEIAAWQQDRNASRRPASHVGRCDQIRCRQSERLRARSGLTKRSSQFSGSATTPAFPSEVPSPGRWISLRRQQRQRQTPRKCARLARASRRPCRASAATRLRI